MKKVVMVAYGFPPVGGGGVQRPTKFVKYLREFGWEPIVLTVANPSVPLLDESLLKDIPEGVKVYRARTLEPSYGTKIQYGQNTKGWVAGCVRVLKRLIGNTLLPDVQVLWWPGLVLKLMSVLRMERPDCIFVTAPPFSSFIPVVVIGSLFNVPVLLDYRDEWSFSRQQWEHAVKTPLAFWLDRTLERFVVKNCAALVAVNTSYIRNLCAVYPELDISKTAIVTNGFDEDDFKGIQLQSRTNDQLNMVYAGTVWNGNSLEPLVRAVKILMDKNSELAKKLRINIYGRVVGDQIDYLNDPALEGIIFLWGYQDHSIVLNKMFNADVLLLSMTDLPGAENIILGKTFEYIATGNHILAIVPRGETLDILEQNYENLSVANPHDIDAIYNILEKLINIDSDRFRLNRLHLVNFSRIKLAGHLADTFNKTLSTNAK